MVVLQGPKGRQFLMIEVPLYRPGAPGGAGARICSVQGYLAHKKQRVPRTLR